MFAALMPSALLAQTTYPYPYPAPSYPSPSYPYPYGQTIPNAPPLEFELGARYWYSAGKSQKTLYDGTGALLLSRLTWTGETGHTGEAYFNITDKGVFAKGYVGVGVLAGGKIQDEDFPPVTAPYSSTDSKAGGGHLSYATADLGYYILNGAAGKLGPFVGYNVFRERMNAFGCTQTATNPGICLPSIPDSVRVLSQENTWHSVRVGAAGEVMLAPNLKLSGDAAYLPYVRLSGADTHWLRLGIDFTGPTPETGRGHGMQFEGILSYYFSDNVSLGVGARYWRVEVPNGTAHFEDSTGGAFGPQVEKFRTDRFGGFVQLGVKY
jgi:outer membrane protease